MSLLLLLYIDAYISITSPLLKYGGYEKNNI